MHHNIGGFQCQRINSAAQGHRRLLSNSGKLPGNSRGSPRTTPTTRTFCPLFMIFPYVRVVGVVRGHFFFKEMMVLGIF
jgi:hypothetical protein